jgi:hypothetical protein
VNGWRTGRQRRAVPPLVDTAIAAAICAGVVVVVSLILPRRVLAIGDDWCFDD